MDTLKPASNMDSYSVGDSDKRPWGEYVVIGVGHDPNGDEYCEKHITVNPGQILSLQSHNHRREYWEVKEGTLEVVMDDKHITLQKGESIEVPLGAIHCMANGSDKPCLVYEKQMGLCSEDDIIRYVDAYGRGTFELDEKSQISVDLYNKVREEIA
ncbi:MAG: phosphomannose isomerase type II C-terminal cupin domain [Alphaproteobacteria bacterium]|nr:phosphomannose isomerase type II C-terminal cupin domain [Alphaproteobacteria bacterium]